MKFSIASRCSLRAAAPSDGTSRIQLSISEDRDSPDEPRRVRVDSGRYLPDLLGVGVGEKCDKAGFPAVEVFVEGPPRRARPPHDIGDRRAGVAILGDAVLQGIE
jgi:hypothetical protein